MFRHPIVRSGKQIECKKYSPPVSSSWNSAFAESIEAEKIISWNSAFEEEQSRNVRASKFIWNPYLNQMCDIYAAE